jgi:hypothetical protein
MTEKRVVREDVMRENVVRENVVREAGILTYHVSLSEICNALRHFWELMTRCVIYVTALSQLLYMHGAFAGSSTHSPEDCHDSHERRPQKREPHRLCPEDPTRRGNGPGA